MSNFSETGSAAQAKLRYTPAGAALYELLTELARAEAAGATRGLGGGLALLRAMSREPGRTVAELARAQGLSRQGVQRVAHALRGEGLVAFEPNPRHRRAPCLTLTEAGRGQLASLEDAEAARVHELARGLDPVALRAAARTLRALRARLRPGSARGGARQRPLGPPARPTGSDLRECP